MIGNEKRKVAKHFVGRNQIKEYNYKQFQFKNITINIEIITTTQEYKVLHGGTVWTVLGN